METATVLSITPDMSPRAQAVATARYIDLIEKIGAELAHRTGWRGEAAKRVGISSSLLSQILRGRKVTRGTLEKAIVAMKLDTEYFGSPADLRDVPDTEPPPGLRRTTPVIDPLLVLEGFKALPIDTRRRLLVLMQAIGPR